MACSRSRLDVSSTYRRQRAAGYRRRYEIRFATELVLRKRSHGFGKSRLHALVQHLKAELEAIAVMLSDVKYSIVIE